ncbi:MAG TPA: adenylate/guanylate cyclase domain-containing protein, partial [Flavobacteriales bacterium]|nr:adenylate/guanylate cyclase domain-containing protein [Flavobacteriales bacterium]
GMMSEAERDGPYLDSSLIYQQRSLAVTKAIGDRNGVMILFSNLAAVAGDRHEYRLALAYLDSASLLTDELQDLGMATKVENQRSQSFFALGLLDSAYQHLKLHLVLKDSLLNTEKVKAIADVQEKYESEKKAKEILGLKAENLEGELDKARVKRTRNIYLFTGIGVVLLAGGLWNRLRFVHRSRAAIQKEKDISEGLLLNILPEEVAAELKAKGYADAREFETATILFTDFKGFTSLSEKLTAGQLVAEIDHCFKAFDGIMEKYGIEKIKTIGDAYMAAGGLPVPENGTPVDVVQAALEMQAFMKRYAGERQAEGRLHFEMRVGIHTGPVIAGIVGVKKFAYDIWGDTVNIASRMESSGEVGRVNISEFTYALVKDTPGLAFTPRGKVQAKGKGEMTMYFAEQA